MKRSCSSCGGFDEDGGSVHFTIFDKPLCTNCYRPMYEALQWMSAETQKVDERFDGLKQYIEACARRELLLEIEHLIEKHKMGPPATCYGLSFHPEEKRTAEGLCTRCGRFIGVLP